jgi:hypothetical protein
MLFENKKASRPSSVRMKRMNLADDDYGLVNKSDLINKPIDNV